MANQGEQGQVASPYSTGGGGTVLEHRYGAVLLGHLLLGDPAPELGDDVVPVSVRFQDSAFSPVDDLIVVGRTSDGAERRVSIGVRRAPKLTTSDTSTADLLVSYLRVVTDHWDEVRAGRWRLALAVTSPNPAVQQVRELAVIARDQPDKTAFRTAVAQPGRIGKPVRDRLVHIDALIAKAAAEAKMDLAQVGAGELTWRVLHALRLRELRLEGVDEADRTFAVSRLRTIVPDASVASANTVFEALEKLSGRYAPSAATVTEAMLRQHLSGIPIDRSPSYLSAWRVLDGLDESIEHVVHFRLADADADLELDRAEARAALAIEMESAAAQATALVITGEPDVGKSALALKAARQLAANGAVVTTLSLRDVPASLVEFEALLETRLVTALGGTAVGTTRLLVIDGAESVLEGRLQLLIDIANAAMTAGLGVAAVTRTDSSVAVADGLRRASQGTDRIGAAPQDVVREHEVPRLTTSEIEQLSTTFPQLGRWADDLRAVWLLGRPGLVDMLLRAGPAATMPDGALSEADLFALVWRQLVRRSEIMLPGGPSPDARDHALKALARRELVPHDRSDIPDAVALPSLRSDGLLRPPGPTSAWSPSDRFASDLVRDMSVARLFITDGFDLLAAADAPRWALRAVRIACQAYLLDTPDVRTSFSRLRTVFTDLAAHHGQRWGEIPWEALLTLGSSQDALTRTWPDLLTEQRAGLRTVLRLAQQRYTQHDFGDPIILGPLVELTFCGDLDVVADDRHTARSVGESIRELVLAWLRGLINTNTGPLPLRQRVRDQILASNPPLWDEFAVEALAMLGPDLDQRAEGFLTSLADDGGDRAYSAVERLGPVLMMSGHQPELLLSLAESYYIERRGDEDAPYGVSGYYLFDDGIRHHRSRGGVSARMVAWYYGPFWQLLRARPKAALAFINRMLDHAAAIRVGDPEGAETQPLDDLPGADLGFPGVGVRHCVGDEHVWSWYRGSSVGPYPCMSALLAVERYADQLVVAGIPLEQVVKTLLRECHNLAMPGLVVGFLVRHLEQSGDLLDQWFCEPDVWHLEFSRITGEGVLHVQGPDPADLVGRTKRTHSLRDVAAEATMRAMLAGDQERLNALAATGDNLVRRAQELVAAAGDSSGGDDSMTSVQEWAAFFRPENYHTRLHDGNSVVQYEHPEDIAARLAPGAETFSRVSEALRLQNTYGRSEDRLTSAQTLPADIALARAFADDPPNASLNPLDPVAAVAAAAAVAQNEGRAQIPQEDLRWATDILIKAITAPSPTEYVDSSIYPLGADRSAAVGLPALLASASEHMELDRHEIARALIRCAANHFDEVRIAFALAVKRVWDAPCDADPSSGMCRHQVAWGAVQEGLRDCRLGDWDFDTQQRVSNPLDGPYDETLPLVDTEQLHLKRLMAPLVAAASAARSDRCIAAGAQRVLNALFDAHRRATNHWARKGYENRQSKHSAKVLVETTINGNTQPLISYMRFFASNARALHDLLHDFAVLFTYSDTLRPSLPEVWRVVMTAALDALDDGAELLTDSHWSGYAIGLLLPTPRLDVSDTDPDTTLEHARQNWLPPDSIVDLVTRWIPVARREPKALDALAQLSACATFEWQAETGLGWAEQLIDGEYAAVASRCWFLTNWLQTLRSSHEMTPDQTAQWRRLIDGLAANGDYRAADLQRIEE